MEFLTPGDVFEKYRIGKLLGRGGMGAVYLVHHKILESSFALKVLFPDVAAKNKQFVDRFIREAKLACKIKHPNLIAVYDAGKNSVNGMYYLVMEYVEGISLRELLERNGTVAPARAVEIVTQVASALETAWKYNMVHRDIKPDNIMFAADGTVKLADLGIAKSSNEQDTRLTLEASVFGTPAYMSPEQAMDSRQVDCRADIYSLGIVFFEMLTGERPYQGESIVGILSQVVQNENIPDIRAVQPTMPADLAELVAAMTDKNLKRRIKSPSDLLKRLANIAPQSEKLNAKTSSRVVSQVSADVTLPTLADKPMADPDMTMPTLVKDMTAVRAPARSEEKGEVVGPKFVWRRSVILAAAGFLCCIVLIAAGLIVLFRANQADATSIPGASVQQERPVRRAAKPVMEQAPAPEKLVENAIVVLGSGSEALKQLLAAKAGKNPVMFLEAEVFSQYRNQLKEIVKSKPFLVILALASRYAELDMSRSNFEMLIRSEANLLKDAGVPFIFVTASSPADSPKVEAFETSVRELCKLQSYHLIDLNAQDIDSQFDQFSP